MVIGISPVMRGVEGFYHRRRCLESACAGNEELLRYFSVFLRVGVKVVFCGRCLYVAVTRIDKASHDAGQLLHRVQGRFTAGSKLHEGTVLCIPDTVYDADSVTNRQAVSRLDFFLALIEVAFNSEAVAGSFNLIERDGLCCAQSHNLGVKDLLGSIQNGGDGIDVCRV